MVRYSKNPFDKSILNSNASRTEAPFMVIQHCIYNLISMVDYDYAFTVYCWCLRGFLSYKQVVHNSGLPDIYTLFPQACGPRALDVNIRQTTCAHVTTIQCIYTI